MDKCVEFEILKPKHDFENDTAMKQTFQWCHLSIIASKITSNFTVEQLNQTNNKENSALVALCEGNH